MNAISSEIKRMSSLPTARHSISLSRKPNINAVSTSQIQIFFLANQIFKTKTGTVLHQCFGN